MIFFPNRMQAEAVIFDFDGVIVDTEPIHYKSFQHVLAPLGLNFSWQEYLDVYIGFDDRDAFRESFKANNKTLLPEELSSLIVQKAIVFQEIIRDGVTPYPGVLELIQKLRSTNMPLAICSGALKSDIEPILEQLCIKSLFDVIISAEDVVSSKPNPACYQLAFDKLLATQRQPFTKCSTIAIEDTPAGITSAKLAGLQVCAVSNSYSADFLSDATFTVSSLEHLLDLKYL